MAKRNLGDLVSEVARQYGRYATGTATGGSTSTIIDTSLLIDVDDFWKNCFAYIIDTTDHLAPKGQERAVSDHDQSSQTATVDPVFGAAVGAGDVYEITPLRRHDIEAAINAAIRNGGDVWLVYTEDGTTHDVDTDDYDYALPAAVVKLVDVRYRTNTGDPWEQFPREWYSIAGASGAQELRIHNFGHVPDGDDILLCYYARQPELTSDASTIDVGEHHEAEFVEFIINYALYYLHRKAASEGGQDMATHVTLYQDCLKRADALKEQAILPEEPPSQVQAPQWSEADWG